MKIIIFQLFLFLFSFSVLAQSSNEEKQYQKVNEKNEKLTNKIIEEYVKNLENFGQTKNYDESSDTEFQKTNLKTSTKQVYYFDASLSDTEPAKYQLFMKGNLRTIPTKVDLDTLRNKEIGTEEQRTLYYLIKENIMSFMLDNPEKVHGIYDIQIGDTCQLPILTSQQWPYTGVQGSYYTRPPNSNAVLAEYDQVLTYSPEGYHFINNVLSKYVDSTTQISGTFFKADTKNNIMAVDGEHLEHFYQLFQQDKERAYESIGTNFKKEYGTHKPTQGILLYDDTYTYEMPSLPEAKTKVINVYDNIDLLENKLEEGKINVDVESIYKQLQTFLNRDVYIDEQTGLIYELDQKPEGIEVSKVQFKATHPKILGALCSSSASRVSISESKAREAAAAGDKSFIGLNINENDISAMAKVSQEVKDKCRGITNCNKLLADARRAQCTAVAAKVFEKLLKDPSNHPFLSGLLNQSGDAIHYTLKPEFQSSDPVFAKATFEKNIDHFIDGPINIFSGNSSGLNKDGTSGPEYFRCWDKKYSAQTDCSKELPKKGNDSQVNAALDRVKKAYSSGKEPSETDKKLLKEIFYYPHQYVRLNLIYASDKKVEEVVEKEIPCHEFAYLRLLVKEGKYNTPPNTTTRRSKGKPILECKPYSDRYFKRLGANKRSGSKSYARKSSKRVARACKGNPKRPLCNMIKSVCQGLGICRR